VKTLLALAARWREEAGLLRGYGASQAAAATELHAREVVEAVKQAENEELTLEEAAAASGYARRTIRQKVSEGEIPNVGRRNAPRVRRGDLPMRVKAKKVDSFDASAEARSILGGK
jgi:hypothetical protein